MKHHAYKINYNSISLGGKALSTLSNIKNICFKYNIECIILALDNDVSQVEVKKIGTKLQEVVDKVFVTNSSSLPNKCSPMDTNKEEALRLIKESSLIKD